MKLNENIKSFEDLAKCFVSESFEKCKGNADLEDGYWHVLTVSQLPAHFVFVKTIRAPNQFFTFRSVSELMPANGSYGKTWS